MGPSVAQNKQMVLLPWQQKLPCSPVGFHHPSCEPQNKKRAVKAFNAGERIRHRKDSISSFHQKTQSETRSSRISSFQGEKDFGKESSGEITLAMITTNTSSSGGTGRCYRWHPRDFGARLAPARPSTQRATVIPCASEARGGPLGTAVNYKSRSVINERRGASTRTRHVSSMRNSQRSETGKLTMLIRVPRT